MEVFALLIGGSIGIAFVVVHAKIFYASMSRHNWDKVIGHVHRAVIEEYDKRSGMNWYQVRVEYDYTYRAVIRRGYCFVGQSSFDREELRKRSDTYTPGQALDVYVYKKNPGESALVREIKYGNLVQLIFGVALLGFCLLRLLRYI
ncbi:MAG: hypothetical protein A3I66_10080 [Burkholderiales bacterium RIFCSPLOWO2_02_FULL_57_36]|nr:MAG: hypothetical protein A3I66_10080 [Burkholderiales bacterium RIFCSPLOWO2_02_FULL_57_36]